MKMELAGRYVLGDMEAVYVRDERGRVELNLLPAGCGLAVMEKDRREADGLVQVKIAGDVYPGGYAGGQTLRQGPSAEGFTLRSQRERETAEGRVIETVVEDERGLCAIHRLFHRTGGETAESTVEFINSTEEKVALEMLASFSLAGLSPYLQGDGYGRMKIHRIRSVWSMEGRLETRRAEELQLEPSWGGHAVRAERFGQAGSLSVNKYFPYLMVEDEENGVFWGAQIAHNASWQMEVYRKDDGLSISGGLADREFGHWMKHIGPGEHFTTPTAILTVCRGGSVDDASQRLTSSGLPFAEAGPASEQTLPLVFNEYCTTWGCPSHENILGILEKIKDRGFTYFVIDCGWYKQKDVPWDVSMGDYDVSEELFPQGLQSVADSIKEAGMIPGIWFEIGNVGSASRAYRMEEHLLKRDGRPLTTTMRRFWDMTDPWVEEYLTEKVIGLLRKYGFGYMKMDDNDTVGIGCDGAESLGEALRRNAQAGFGFVEKVKREIPGIVLENCASGGHRLEPSMMRLTSMSSFSDAHECPEIPIIAANLHRVILPSQSQIWAVIRADDTPGRICYSMAAAFLGRLCLSGDVTGLTEEQWRMIDEGIAFYRRIAPIIREGHTRWYGTPIGSYRHPQGYQAIFREGRDGTAYLVLHTFGGQLPPEVTLDLPGERTYRVRESYSDESRDIRLTGGKLTLPLSRNWSAAAFYLVS